ncbi:MAG: ECF-type sigma factor [Thermoguttaceae bacterium]|jgi:RNA polymerase sigma factor (sigma-70 family)
MPSGGSITHWIREVRQGDSAAAEALWKRYFPKLVQLAQKKLQGLSGQMADEEDVALSAMNRFYQAAEEGRYPDLADREGLWRLLLEITAHRVIDLRRRENRQRRGGGQCRSSAARNPTGSEIAQSAVFEAPDDTPTPEVAAMMANECQRLLEELHDGELQAIATAKMEGASNAEIAAQLNCSQRTVERRLRLIRDKWKHFWTQEKESEG